MPGHTTHTSAAPAVELQAVTKQFSRVTALRNLSLSIPRGSVFGLIGANGAGKTTTLRLLLDLLRPTAGSIQVLGQNPRAGGKELRRKIGYLPGELVLDPHVTGRVLLQRYCQYSRPDMAKNIPVLAERLGAELNRKISTLSKGNKQKLGLIQAFMHEPELLILDEPSSGLDPILQHEFMALVHEAAHRGQTVLLSSHVLSEVEQVAQDAAVLRQGELVVCTNISQLRKSAVRTLHARIDPGPGQSAANVATQVSHSLQAHLPEHSLQVSVDERNNSVIVNGKFGGIASGAIKGLAPFVVVDLSVSAADLEELILDMYQEGQHA